MRKDRRLQLLLQYLVYLGGFLLFWEWLRPLEEITDTGGMPIFVLFTAFCFMLSALSVRWWLSASLKLLALLLILQVIFIPNTFFAPAWFQFIETEFQTNLQALWVLDWVSLTPFFRSMLFLVLLWLMSYLLYYWFVVVNRVFFFILMTFLYVSILDTFTTYDASQAVVRIFIVSFAALGINTLLYLLKSEKGSKPYHKAVNWVLPLIAAILFSTAVGYAAPKLDPQWPDPVPFLRSTSEQAGEDENGGGVQKVGYGEDDSRLGGPFIQDNSRVFRAAAANSGYWRVDSKDVYTGLGWERSSELNYTDLQSGEPAGIDLYNDNVESVAREAVIYPSGTTVLERLVYPYGAEAFSTGPLAMGVDEEYGTVQAFNQADFPNASYTISYEEPRYNITDLQADGGSDPEELSEQYTQLPETLPDRVGELAAEITAEAENRYDQAYAIEQYFNQNGFSYQTQDIPVPEEGQDYVDQFLFESKIGYCDNFSSSMVVMLRTLDIPARWVKGFTGGTITINTEENAPEGLNTYAVTNANAHSWVEVYFPETGWVPFEPTQGFANEADFVSDEEEQEETPTPETENDTEEEESAPEAPEQQQEEDTAAAAPEASSNNWIWFGVLGAALLSLLGLFYYFRYSLLTFWKLRRYRHKADDKTYEQAYMYLLRLLKHKGYARKSGETLRDFSRRIDSHFRNTDMTRLTRQYERILYRNDDSTAAWRNHAELWENLIKQAAS